MRVSEHWLREIVRLPADHDALVERLNMIGHEVEADAAIGTGLDDVVVARIISCARHPQADRLQVCRVDTGDTELDVVCGAPNARAGLLAPLAKVGAALPGGVTIEAASIRGVESHGMLCSARELGLDADASGLLELPADASPGQRLDALLGLPDHVLDLGLTPNRGDCLSMTGIASDVAAAFGVPARPVTIEPIPGQTDRRIRIELAAPADCPRYCGRYLEGVDAGAPTPGWIAERLRRSGIRPISLLVDVTQYVMIELGQPMHAFDAARLQGPIGVRRARDGESLKLLDGNDVSLDPGFLLITDADRPVALAGVMGGFDTRVTDGTKDVFLEAAHFAPMAIAGRARRLNMVTDAAHRFERGVDPELPRRAVEHATALILAAAGGQAGPLLEAVDPGHLPERPPISLRRDRIRRVLGIGIPDAEVVRILTALDLEVAVAPDGWRATPPSRRFDLACEEDLIEELARIHGYDRIPSRLPAGSPPEPRSDEARLPASDLRAQLAARGYHEAVCYAFTDVQRLRDWHDDSGVVMLSNPLSAELGAMRTSLLPGLVDVLIRNRRRQQPRVRLFEIGRVFHASAEPGAAPIEVERIAAVACGPAVAEQWGEQGRPVDFHDIKGDLESVLAMTGDPGSWAFDASALPPWLHPGRGARIIRDRAVVGTIGVLHPGVAKALDLDGEVVVFEADAAALSRRSLPRVTDLPAFPSLRRDLAVEVAREVPWAALEACVRGAVGSGLTQLTVFDVYQGQGLTPGRKSVAMGLILQDASRTLTDQDADRWMAAAVGALEREFGARLRG